MTDIIDRIDELVAEQMADGEPWNGFDAGDPDFPRCPHCDRHWHGLPITERIADMYGIGFYDEDYRVDTDTTTVLCQGSDFIGPRRPTAGETFQANLIRDRRDIGGGYITISQHFDMSGWASLMERAQVAFAGVAVFRTHELTLNGWGSQPRDPFQWARGGVLPPALVRIEFGPHTWHYELQREIIIPPQAPVPQSVPLPPIDPLRGAVWDLWPTFTRPSFPVPPNPGYDFSRHDTLMADDTPGWNALATNGPRPAAAPPGRHRRTAPRSR